MRQQWGSVVLSSAPDLTNDTASTHVKVKASREGSVAADTLAGFEFGCFTHVLGWQFVLRRVITLDIIRLLVLRTCVVS